jgi:hypothetical protein
MQEQMENLTCMRMTVKVQPTALMRVAAAYLRNVVKAIAFFSLVSQSEVATRECLMSEASKFFGGD